MQSTGAPLRLNQNEARTLPGQSGGYGEASPAYMCFGHATNGHLGHPRFGGTTCMRSGRQVRSKDQAFWTMGCEIYGTDRVGGTLLQIRPRCLYIVLRSIFLPTKPTSTAAAPDPVRPHLLPTYIQGDGDDLCLAPSLLWQRTAMVATAHQANLRWRRWSRLVFLSPNPLSQLDPLSRAARS
jgi:hypothetical protein